VKRRDLIRRIEDLGAVLIRHGGKHDWHQNPATKKHASQSRGTTKSTKNLARSIIKKLSSE
jgi:hypothetical protein